MSKLVKLFQNLDQFGALSQIQFFNSDEKFKTVYGGMLSIVIYSLGFIYFLYLMVLWQTQQILPNVTNQSIYNPNLRHQKLNSPLFDFSVEIDEVSKQLRTIEKMGDLFTYSIYSSNVDNTNTKLTSNVRGYQGSFIRGQYDYFDPVCMNLNDEYQTNLNANSMNRSEDTYVEFYINSCDPLYASNCLSLRDQSIVYNQVGFDWRLTLYTQDVDLRTGSIINKPQDHYFTSLGYQNLTGYSFDLKIRYATFIIDTGLFFASTKEIQVVYSISLTVTQNQLLDQVTNKPALAFITYSLDREESIIRVTRPKLGQILAELGSIIQILLFSGLIMNKFNDTIMNTKIEEALLKIYFPQIIVFKFIYDWRGRIRKIQFRNKNLENQDFKSVKEFRESAGKELRQKLNYFSILHEISRLQIKLQQKEQKQDIIKLQGLGYRMNLPETLGTEINNQDQFLDYQDFLNLIYQKRIEKKIDIDKIYVENYQNSNDIPDTPLEFSPQSIKRNTKIFFQVQVKSNSKITNK